MGDLEKLEGYVGDLKIVRSFFLLLMPLLVAYVNFWNYLVCVRKFFRIDLRKLYSGRLSYKFSYKVFHGNFPNFFLRNIVLSQKPSARTFFRSFHVWI